MLPPAFLEKLWYGNHPVSVLLAPLGWLYGHSMQLRHTGYRIGLLPTRQVNVPVIIVGNITVGGTGKTPLVIWLADHLKSRGYSPGIISRGYGGRSGYWPQQVRPDSDPYMVGDEPVIIARRTDCPVAASPDRYAAACGLLEHNNCDILICDDGLQHRALARDLELAVIDGARRFGNGRCLPAGPLREPVARLQNVDMVIANGRAGRGEYTMQIEAVDLRSVNGNKVQTLSAFGGRTVHAVAGIGNPDRFFALLKESDIYPIKHVYPDHHAYKKTDILFNDDLPVLMTEKDAIKCTGMADARHWYLVINARMDDVFQYRLNKLLQDITDGQKTA